jgi:hypothetical protein
LAAQNDISAYKANNAAESEESNTADTRELPTVFLTPKLVASSNPRTASNDDTQEEAEVVSEEQVEALAI